MNDTSPWLRVRAEPMIANAAELEREFAWFAEVVDARFKHYFGAPDAEAGVSPMAVAPPDLADSVSPYAALLRRQQASAIERLALALALVTHCRPQLLDIFHTRNQTFDRPFTEFGGRRSASGNFVPTGQTLAFVVAGAELAPRFALQALFERDHWFATERLLHLGAQVAGEPLLDAPLELTDEALALATTGRAPRPSLGVDFPARPLETRLEWHDLVLHPDTLAQLQEVRDWIRHGDTLMNGWGMAPRLRPGCRALFYGPPGTGKTMTAALLGKASAREVWQVDLSLVVSKYIGETEKNLARIFAEAQHKGWILFFDEADALFGKRSETRDAHDRYANQEVAYLLQRIETFDGIVILASNLRDHIDPAFARRFEAVVYFPVPASGERLRLWRQSLPRQATLAADVDLATLADNHALCGGAILNAVRHACLVALADGSGCITQRTLLRAVAREYEKEGRLA